jgi:transformation/transcription domain-associated protein
VQGYITVADLVYNLQNELKPSQLPRLMHAYSRFMHNPYLSTICEDSILDNCVGKLDSITEELEQLKKAQNDNLDTAFIERAGAVYAVEKFGDAVHGR